MWRWRSHTRPTGQKPWEHEGVRAFHCSVQPPFPLHRRPLLLPTLQWMQWFPPHSLHPPTPPLIPTPTLWLFDNSSGGAGMSAVQRDTHIKASKCFAAIVQRASESTLLFVCAQFIFQDQVHWASLTNVTLSAHISCRCEHKLHRDSNLQLSAQFTKVSFKDP